MNDPEEEMEFYEVYRIEIPDQHPKKGFMIIEKRSNPTKYASSYLLFQGVIDTISEFKVLIKQLGINE